MDDPYVGLHGTLSRIPDAHQFNYKSDVYANLY